MATTMGDSYVVVSVDCDEKARCFGSENVQSAVGVYTAEVLRGMNEEADSRGTHVVFVSLESFDASGNPLNSINSKEELECEHTRRSDAELAARRGGGRGA